MRRQSRWIGNVALLVGSSILGLLVLELGLRLAGISFPRFYITDQYRGVALRPGAEGWWRKEGSANIRINSDGLRDREHSLQKPVGTYRIAVLGDSYAEAFQLPMEEAFWSEMERALQTCSSLEGRTAEVINFGVSGYGTAQELMTLRYKVWAYQPDLVVLAILTANDLKNNVRALEHDPLRPYFVVMDDSLVLDDSYLREPHYLARRTWRAKLLYSLLDHLRVLQVVNESRNAIRNLLAQRQEGGAGAEPVAEVGLTEAIYSAPVSDLWKDAWDVTERLVVQMGHEIRERDAAFLVVTLSNSIQVHPDANKRRDFMQRLGVTDFFYPDLRLRSLADRVGIPILNLAPVLQQRAEASGAYYHGFRVGALGTGHWNATGHKVAGQLIAAKVCDLAAP